MTNIDEMTAVLQAAKDGKVIQARVNGEWLDAKPPHWNFPCVEYRVKPAPVVLGLQVATTKGGEFIYTPHSPNLELEFIDGVLTGAKVL